MSTNGNNLQEYRRQLRRMLGILRMHQNPVFALLSGEPDDDRLKNKMRQKNEIFNEFHKVFQATRQEMTGSRISIRTMRSIYTPLRWQTPTRRTL